MQLHFTTNKDDLFSLEVAADMELENLKAYCEVECGVPAARMALIWNSQELADNTKTLGAYGIGDGEMLFIQVKRVRPASSTAHPQLASIDFSSLGKADSSPGPSSRHAPKAPTDPYQIREMLLQRPRERAILKQNNQPLADALDSGNPEEFVREFQKQADEQKKRREETEQLLRGDPFDPEVQRKIAEKIKEENVNANMEAAMEFSPESFAQVHMLYIHCLVNGQPVKAFVDSGAQMTIMSQRCADRCHISHLIDRRWAGIAKGVGIQKILGRVHMCQIKIQGHHFQCSFSILENQPMDMLLGLDMLKRHQCCIDLRDNVLVIGSSGSRAEFLAENELPSHARLNRSISEVETENQYHESVLEQQDSQASTSTSGPQEQNIRKIMSSGFTRERAIEQLNEHGGDVDKALISLLTRTLGNR